MRLKIICSPRHVTVRDDAADGEGYDKEPESPGCHSSVTGERIL